MRFFAEHLIEGIAVEDYGKLYFDPEFNDRLCQAVNLDRTELLFRTEGSKVVRHVRVEPKGRDIPAPLAKLLGESKFSYVEELEVDLAKNEGVFRILPVIFGDKVTAGGKLRFVDAGGSTRRIVDGAIDVRVFGIGGLVERFICADVEKSYGDAAVFTRAFLRERASR